MIRVLAIAFREIAHVLSVPLIWLLMPFKVFAFRTRFRFLKRVILGVTSFFDWAMVIANIQNPTMLIHHKAYRGNFIFGKSVMVVDHEVAEREIAPPTLRGNRFMGVDLVTNDPMAFVTNAGPITTGQPIRRLHREYIEQEIMTAEVRDHDLSSLRDHCAELLDEWTAEPRMATVWSIRGAVTRLILRILTNKILPTAVTDDITFQYMRRFAEFSLFGSYFPMLIELLGTREAIRRDAYIRLRRYGIDNVTIDMTLFAAMFSLGTIVLKCVEFTRKYHIDYAALSENERIQFTMEAQRLYPTVTSVHRIAEEDETIQVRGRDLRLGPGDEVAYPFICINRDAHKFNEPDAFKVDRPREELERILSWSIGRHACPAKELSILVTVLMLDTLSSRFDLRQLRIFSPEF